MSAPPLDIALHVKYIQDLYQASFVLLFAFRDQADEQKKDLAYHLTEHLRVNGVYWGLTALCIMGHKDALPREEMIDYVLSCWDDEAGMSLCTFARYSISTPYFLGAML
jgi:geranylgeranyl transferase type-2 subunit beta